MKKVIVLLICLVSVVAIILLAAKSDKRDFSKNYLDHALLYGLKDLVDEDDIEVLETIEYSHADFKFWGIPDIN